MKFKSANIIFSSLIFVFLSGCDFLKDDTHWEDMSEEDSSKFVESTFGEIVGLKIISGKKEIKDNIIGFHDHKIVKFNLSSELAPIDWLVYLVEAYTGQFSNIENCDVICQHSSSFIKVSETSYGFDCFKTTISSCYYKLDFTEQDYYSLEYEYDD